MQIDVIGVDMRGALEKYGYHIHAGKNMIVQAVFSSKKGLVCEALLDLIRFAWLCRNYWIGTDCR